MREFAGLDEIRGAVGTHVGYSEWHEITQARIDTFANATGDFQWIHVDAERSASGPFGKTIAHGYLTLSLVPFLVQGVYRLSGVKMGVNYGANKLRFPGPVLVSSTVRAGVEFADLTELASGLLLTTVVTVDCSTTTKPVCVAELLTLLVPES